MKELLVVGGGFAGLNASLCAANEVIGNNGDVHITLISKDEYLTLRPRLYQKNPEKMKSPLKPILEPLDVSFIQGGVKSIDLTRRSVVFDDIGGERTSLRYDSLIIAMGSKLRELPIDGASEHTWNIDDYDAAVAFDRHLKRVVRTPNMPGCNTFVIIGGGLTGIELAMEMRGRIRAHGGEEISAKARIILLERATTVGHGLGGEAEAIIEKAMKTAGVETVVGAKIAKIHRAGIEFSDAEFIETATVVVTAGLRANPIAGALGVECDELGRLPVDEMLRVKGVSGIYAAGDVARAYVDDSNLALMSCQHAMPMGKFAGYNAARELLQLPLRPYRQSRYVTCFDLGETGGLFTVGWDHRVEATGSEAKDIKKKVNEVFIHPPQGDRAAILAASGITAGSA